MPGLVLRWWCLQLRFGQSGDGVVCGFWYNCDYLTWAYRISKRYIYVYKRERERERETQTCTQHRSMLGSTRQVYCITGLFLFCFLPLFLFLLFLLLSYYSYYCISSSSSPFLSFFLSFLISLMTNRALYGGMSKFFFFCSSSASLFLLSLLMIGVVIGP